MAPTRQPTGRVRDLRWWPVDDGSNGARDTGTVLAPMQSVLFTQTTPELEALLERRRALGQDTFDEVWEGEYRVVPGPGGVHSDVDSQVTALLRAPARAAGLWPLTQSNIGPADLDYRVPDQVVLRERSAAAYHATAAIVVEILSPRDRSYEKFDFYLRHGVEEILIVDPYRRAVEWYAATPDGFTRVDRSALLDLMEQALAAAIDWPPTD